jgi:hypothetical protein
MSKTKTITVHLDADLYERLITCDVIRDRLGIRSLRERSGFDPDGPFSAEVLPNWRTKRDAIIAEALTAYMKPKPKRTRSSKGNLQAVTS